MSIANIRQDYTKGELNQAYDDPFELFRQWFSDAQAAQQPEVNAMTLSTVDATGRPSSRIVLLKEIDHIGFTFFTNYLSKKGQDLSLNPYASLVFFWPTLERQIRIEGQVDKIHPKVSDTYFASRPYLSKIGAWASRQSQVIPNRDVLVEAEQAYQARYPDQVPRPDYWGGYRLIPDRIEFWQGRPSRLHDRIVYTQGINAWISQRLSP